MKHFLVLTLLIPFFTSAQQEQFIIGADWGNTVQNVGEIYPEYSSEEFWNTAEAFGLNMINLNYFDKVIPPDRILAEFDKAHKRGMSVFFNNYTMIPYTKGHPDPIRRWLLEAEYKEDCSIESDPPLGYDEDASVHWSITPVLKGTANFLQLPGSIKNGETILTNNSDLLFNTKDALLIAKVRVRMKNEARNDNAPVLRLELKGDRGGVWGELAGEDISDSDWQVVDLIRFSASDIGSVNEENVIPVDIELYRTGEASIDIDWIAIDDKGADNLFNGKYDESIIKGVTTYMHHPALKYYKLWDEPFPENLLPIGYMNSLIHKTLQSENTDDLGFKTGLCFNNKRIIQQFLSQTNMKIHLVDRYPFYKKWQKVYTEDGYVESIQNQMDWNYLPRLRDEITFSQKYNVPLWTAIQTHSWHDPPSEHWLREPTADEIRLLVHLGICYGAKGIHYFSYSKPPYGAGLLEADGSPRMKDTLGLPKWQPISELNAFVASIGDELVNLRWENSYSYHLQQPLDSYIQRAASMTAENGTIQIDDPDETYIELGLFTPEDKSDSAEYFYVVNRRTKPNDLRLIRIFIDKSSTGIANWRVTDLSDNRKWDIKAADSFMAAYLPGGGRLFKLEPLR